MYANTVMATALLVALAVAPVVRAEETFDVSTFEKKTFELTGFVELRPEQQSLRRDSTGYQLQYRGDTLSAIDRLSTAAEVSGVLRHKSLSFHFTGHASAVNDSQATSSDSRMYEAYASWQVDPTSVAEIGKRAVHWGKGYAFSPVAFLERPKDPSDPELAREGFVMATGSLVRSFDGPLQTLTLTSALVPTTSELNADFGASGHLNPALKLYGLIYDTDVDLIYAAGGSRGPRLGLDFSRNLGSNLEIHGEWARSSDATRSLLTPANGLAIQTRSYDSYLLGLRYLTERDTTIVFEYYRNGNGYSPQELSQFYDLVQASAANAALVQPASRAASQGYMQPNVGQNYLYLKVSQKEPFDILNFTPSVTLIANADDHSFSLVPEALYTGFKNLELRFRLALNSGNASTDYGEKPVRSRVELRARYFF
ncbi:MAG TPA: hypothetical protein DCP03_17995 [Polaromonas sp.]|uniref:hypothetical protein n=1 Tax=Polaromonas sp. UBA4122 TaxID=1947074 RepID=UPI000ECAC27D|nr:hypothetical protein [Polaromonas sp. UBA4122]HAL39889.1 hypothetical protein [Polaromonas sp.]